MIKKELKGFNINIDDIEPNEITHGAMQKLIENIIIEENVKRFEIILNKNILNIKDRFTDIHSYMGLKLSLEPLEKDISFIIRPTNELTYDELQQENKQLKEDNYVHVNYTNKLQRELNEENLQCSKYAIEINDLKEKYNKQVSNWNKLKEKITDGSKAYSCRCYELVFDIEEVPKEQWNDFISYLAFNVMQELIKHIEQGSDSNE